MCNCLTFFSTEIEFCLVICMLFSEVSAHFLNHPQHFQNSKCIARKNLYAQHHTMTCKIVFHLLKVNNYVNGYVSTTRMQRHFVIVHGNLYW